jgi:hypothetical protein
MRSRPPVSLTDSQLQAVMTAAASLPPEKRTVFLERVAGTLARPDALHYRHPDDHDVSDAVDTALIGLLARAEVA